MKDVTFTFVGDENIGALAALAHEIWHEYWPFLLSEEQISYMVEKFQSEAAIIRQRTEENYRYYFIAGAGGERVGYFGVAAKQGYLFLSKLYVKSDFRHQGIGARAFEKIKQLAEESGHDKIRLTVNRNNEKTIKAYFKYGFEIIAQEVTDIGNGFVMDDYIMEYRLGRAVQA